MKKTFITVAAAIAASLAGPAMASAATDPSATLGVSVAVDIPPCSIALANNGNVSLGAHNVNFLKKDGFNDLMKGEIGLNVDCPVARNYSIRITDGNAGSVATGIGAHLRSDLTDSDVLGFGTSSKGKIGGYLIELADPTRDGTAVQMVPVIGSALAAGEILRPGQHAVAWGTSGEAGGRVPALRSSVTLKVTGAVVGTDQLDLAETQTLAGRATINLTSY